jgi:hypothetical protein
MIFKTVSLKIEPTEQNLQHGEIHLDFTLTDEDMTVIGDFMELGASIIQEIHRKDNLLTKQEIALGMILSFSMCIDFYNKLENGELKHLCD